LNVKTLESKPEQFDECIKLIEKSFNYEDPFHYDEDFKLLTCPENYSNCFFIENESEDVIATLFTLPRNLLFQEHSLKVLFLGGISVRDQDRGAGIFKSLLETVILLNQDCALFFLWSDLSNLYEKFSFYEFGLIEETAAPNEVPFNVTPFNEEDKDKVKIKYINLKDQFLLPERNQSDWNHLFKSSSIKNHRDEKGNFYFLDKGMDLQGICHESHPINAPHLDNYSSWIVNPTAETSNALRYMGFLRLGNLELLNEFIVKTSKGRLSLLEFDSNIIKVEFDNELYEIGQKDFIQGIWGPGQIKEWAGLIPPIIVFGFDSI